MSDQQSTSTSQVQAVADKVIPEGVNTQAPQEIGEKEDLKVVFPSPLALTPEQEIKMVDFALNRIQELEHELGRVSTSQANWYGHGEDNMVKEAAGSFMGKRQLYEMVYHNQIDWRSYLLGGIFAESNLTVPMSRRIAQQQIARSVNYFLGTDPWFGAYPVGASDDETADVTDKYLKHKAQQADLKSTFTACIEGSVIRGESVAKTIYKQDWTQFKTQALIAVNAAGEPFVAADGDYIYQDDAWSQAQPESPGMGEPQAAGGWVLQRDGQTQLPDNVSGPESLVFESQVVPQQKVRYQGAESKPVYYKDFLAPLDATTLDDADCVAHLYDKPAIEIASIYVSALQTGEETPRETSARIFESLQELVGTDEKRRSFADKPRPELGESPGEDHQSESMDGREKDQRQGEPVLEIAEIYLHFDADEDGVQEDIVLMLDRTNRRPLFYDYVANRTPNGRRPFRVARVNRVEGRWHGIGTMEIFQPLQEVVDLLVNRWNLSQSRSGNVIFWNPELTLEGEDNANLELNGGDTYTPKGNIDPETILKVIPLYDIKGREIYKEIEFFMQVAINMSGVSHANDAAMLGMDTSKLATGVRNIERSGQEMFSIYLAQLQDGLEEILRDFCIYTLAYLDQEEAFVYTEDEDALKMVFAPDMIERDMDMDIRLEMTRYKNEQELVQAQQASIKVFEFYS